MEGLREIMDQQTFLADGMQHVMARPNSDALYWYVYLRNLLAEVLPRVLANIGLWKQAKDTHALPPGVVRDWFALLGCLRDTVHQLLGWVLGARDKLPPPQITIEDIRADFSLNADMLLIQIGLQNIK